MEKRTLYSEHSMSEPIAERIASMLRDYANADGVLQVVDTVDVHSEVGGNKYIKVTFNEYATASDMHRYFGFLRGIEASVPYMAGLLIVGLSHWEI